MTLPTAIMLALALQTPQEAAVAAPLEAQPAVADSVPVPDDSYADSAALALMAATRGYAEATKSDIEAYRLMSRYALSIGLNTGRRDRLLYKREMAWRVSWRRDVEWRVDVLGSRELLPLVRRSPSSGDVDAEIGTLDPDFFIGNRGQWVLRLPTAGDDSNSLHHPLAPGSESHYRFATGDTTRIQLPGSPTVTLVELRVLPRYPSARLLSGSFWFDAASAAPVRAAFRLASPARFELDATTRTFLPTVGDATFDIDYLSLEYSLWENRWWLPKLISLQGRGRIGGVDVPLLVEQTFEEIELFASAEEWTPLPPPDTLQFRRHLRDEEMEEDTAEDAAPEEGAKDDRTGDDAGSLERQIYVVRSDSTLVSSPLLAGSGADITSILSDQELSRIRETLAASTLPLGFAQSEVGWTLFDPGLLRYNRVEGLALGSSLAARYGPYSLDAAVRLGVAGPTPSAELGLRQVGRMGDREVRVYSRIQPFTPRDRPLALGNSVGTLLFGRDEGDYFRASGIAASIMQRLSRWNRSELVLSLFAEHQDALERNTSWSIRGRDRLRPNPAADRASQIGFDAFLETRTGVQVDHFRGGISARLRGESGSFSFARGSIESNIGFPLPGPLLGSIEGAVGHIVGSAPLQSIWYLGGPSTVRGFDPEDRISGKTFWRSRGEIATAQPGMRGILFVDAGWAGNALTLTSPQLVSVGAGVSAIDGILRADLARAVRGGSGWGLQLYLDAPL